MPKPHDLRPFAFVLAVPGLDRNTVYCRDALGFSVEWSARTDWQLVRKGSVMLGHCPDALLPSATDDHAYALHAEWAQRGPLCCIHPATATGACANSQSPHRMDIA